MTQLFENHNKIQSWTACCHILNDNMGQGYIILEVVYESTLAQHSRNLNRDKIF